ncbi:MAG: 4,5-DOPA dioxygenase extradiol [Proteobacteria bacterium]|nr:4,5-DOPA dioxygenase extradiol [Pseudomonadota bacterium]
MGHGSPTNALADNAFTAAWRDLGTAVAKPRAILAVSAHWYTRGVYVTSNASPPTIHDFGGFPKPLYALEYPAPGAPQLADRVASLLAASGAGASADWGLDHGTWAVLRHVYPAADVPVVQLSIDATLPPGGHYAIGRQLAHLRDEGILILGSGGIVHNLGRVDWHGASPPPRWATEFDDRVRAAILAGDDATLIDYGTLGEAARISVPTPEHYLPLLYVLGSRLAGDQPRLLTTGFELGSISMTAVALESA